MIKRPIIVALLLLALRPDSSHALTATEIERGVRTASTDVRVVTDTLARDEFGGREAGQPGYVETQDYLIERLREIGPGLSGGSDDASYRQPFEQGTNLIAVIRGRELPEEYVIVGAHYDHIGVSLSGDVFNGATDNAAGTAAALGVGKALVALPEPPRRSVIIALWDAEELGLLGSLHYVANPPVPLSQTVAYVNFDILGSNLTPATARTTFAISSETGGEEFGAIIRDAAAAEDRVSGADAVDLLPLSYIFGQLRSDYASFVAGEIPTVFFSDATGACYHTPGDEADLVDYVKLEQQTRIAYRVAAGLAESDGRLRFREPNPALATYEDAVSLNHVVQQGTEDLRLFTVGDQVTLRMVADDVAAIVEAGPDAFGGADVGVLLDAALTTLAIVDSNLECANYVPSPKRSFARRLAGPRSSGPRPVTGDRRRLPIR